MTDFFDDIKDYVGFTDEDSAVLKELRPATADHVVGIVDRFYDRIRQHPSAHQAIRGGDSQVERLKHTLRQWIDSGLAGPHDHAFYERRARIGRVHVQIGLPQQYMFTAMNGLRVDIHHVAERAYEADSERRRRVNDAIDRWCDLELAIMLQTYREDSNERLRRRERLATLGQVAASIGHDLRNPLGVIESSLYLLKKRIGGDERAMRHLDKISGQVRGCSEIINDLLELARSREPDRETVDVAALLAESAEAAGVAGRATLVVDVDPGLVLEADQSLLRQALVNLFVNALHAMEDISGPARIEVSARDLGGAQVALAVRDHGPGFDPDILAQVFEPLVTTHRFGTGLGLALVRSVVERHRGSVQAANHEEGGAVVTLRLPNGRTVA